MRRLTDPAEVEGLDNPEVRALLALRFRQLAPDTPCVPDAVVSFVLIEPGDTLDSIEAGTACWLRTNPFDDAVYGQADYAASFEVAEAHPGCFELAFLVSDGGEATVLIVPSTGAIDPEVLRYCREFASRAAGNEQEGLHVPLA